jgi:Ribulose-5-phosphate 4-epimerase and related epimerases and aldolases
MNPLPPSLAIEPALASPLDATAAIKEALAKAYYILACAGMDDQTYTHLSARVPGEEAYYIYPLGMLFAEVTPASLLKVSFEGQILEGTEHNFNVTGYIIHSAIYQARPEINAIFHLHTLAGCAVSAMREGLLPLSQFAFHFYNRLGYYQYDALCLDETVHGSNLVKALGPHKAMLLQNHGTLTCGETIEGAYFYTMFLENACKVQVAAMAAKAPLLMPPPAVCEQAAKDMTAFEQGAIGKRDFAARCRVTRFPWEQ